MKADSLYLVHVHQCTAHSGNSQRIFVIAVLFLSSPVRKMLLPSEEKATGGVSPDEQLLFWRRVLGQMKVIAVQRDLQLNEPGDLAAILRLGFLLRFSFLRQTPKKSDSHVRILLLTWPLFRQGQGSRRKQALAIFGPRKALPHGSECSLQKIPTEFRPAADQFCSWRVRCRGLCSWDSSLTILPLHLILERR